MSGASAVLDAEAEELIREARLSWWGLGPKIAVGVMVGMVGLALLMRKDAIGTVGALLGWLVFAWIASGCVLKRMAMKVILTSQCVVLRTGVARIRTTTVMLTRIESIELDQTPWQRLAGYGTLIVRGIGSDDLRIDGLESPLEFQTDVKKALIRLGQRGGF